MLIQNKQIAIVGGIFEPTYNGKLSQSIDENKQGKLQGVNQSLQSVNNMLIPLAAAIYFYNPVCYMQQQHLLYLWQLSCMQNFCH